MRPLLLEAFKSGQVNPIAISGLLRASLASGSSRHGASSAQPDCPAIDSNPDSSALPGPMPRSSIWPWRQQGNSWTHPRTPLPWCDTLFRILLRQQCIQFMDSAPCLRRDPSLHEQESILSSFNRLDLPRSEMLGLLTTAAPHIKLVSRLMQHSWIGSCHPYQSFFAPISTFLDPLFIVQYASKDQFDPVNIGRLLGTLTRYYPAHTRDAVTTVLASIRRLGPKLTMDHLSHILYFASRGSLQVCDELLR